MGTAPQKRLVRRIDLERWLQRVPQHPSPKALFEQYTISVNAACEILFLAAYMHDDIAGKAIVDLGCGTGRLALGAIFLGAIETIGVDIDRPAVISARRNALELNVSEKTCWIASDISAIHGRFDTVLQNPPFGVQRRWADREFLLKALQLAPRVYSLHKAGETNRIFIKRFIERHGGKVTSIFKMKVTIPKQFEFHTETKHEVDVDLYRIEIMR
jgi:putative methylase